MARLTIDLTDATVRELTVADLDGDHAIELLVEGRTTDVDADELQDAHVAGTLRPVAVELDTGGTDDGE